jgi:hypothetical protein
MLKKSLSSYGLWDHFNRMAIDTLFTIDTLILSLFTWIGLNEIASYTIALKFTSMLFIVSLQLHLSLQVYLSNLTLPEDRQDSINSFVKLNALVAIIQFAAVSLFGKWFIRILFGNDIDASVFQFALILTLAVTLMNLSWPFYSVIKNYCDLKKAFIYIFLPNFVFGIGLYFIGTFYWGTIGIAYANVVIYGLMTASIVLFALANYPFNINFSLVTPKEIQFVRNLFKFQL